MKKSLTVLVVIIIIVGIWYAIQTKPDASVPQANVSDVNTNIDNENEIKTNENTNKSEISKKEIDNANVKITFKGFGPGKVHDGSFSKIDSKLTLDGDKFKGDVTVDMNSLTTGMDKLTTDLKSKTFFDVAKYPTATFSPNIFEMAESGQGYVLSGNLTVKGIKKNIIIPVTFSEKLKEYTSNFNIDMKEFGIDQKLANEVVELTVTVPLK